MPDSCFEIIVNGVTRTWRDVEKSAVDAARELYRRDKGTTETAVVDHEAGRRWRVATDYGAPAWVALIPEAAVT